MDWKRAKIILILMFFILNIVLAVVLYNNLKVEEISQQTITNTQKILEQNSVHIECPIPKYVGNDYILQYEENVLDKKKIATELLGNNYVQIGNNSYKYGSKNLVFSSSSGFEFNDSGENKQTYTESKSGMDIYLKELSKKLGIPFGEFKQDDYQDIKIGNSVRAIYKGQYKGYAVFDNFIDVEVNKSGIKSIKYHYKMPLNITSRDVNVIPAYEVLITKMTNYPGIIIREVDMGFKGYTKVDKETKTLYEGLSWRIKTADGKEFYFKASNGEEME